MTAVRDELDRVLCCHGRPMTCGECGEEYAAELAGDKTRPDRGSAWVQPSSAAQADGDAPPSALSPALPVPPERARLQALITKWRQRGRLYKQGANLPQRVADIGRCADELEAALGAGEPPARPAQKEEETVSRVDDHGHVREPGTTAHTATSYVPVCDPQEDPTCLLRGLLSIPGVRQVAARSVVGSIVYNADAYLSRVGAEAERWTRAVNERAIAAVAGTHPGAVSAWVQSADAATTDGYATKASVLSPSLPVPPERARLQALPRLSADGVERESDDGDRWVKWSDVEAALGAGEPPARPATNEEETVSRVDGECDVPTAGSTAHTANGVRSDKYRYS